MTENTLQKSKWFWHWEDDKEEAWLRSMAQQGWHLAKPAYLGQYTFTAGEPRDMVYRLDFVLGKEKTADYIQLFKDAGWDYAGELGSWQYWRKEAKAGAAPEIFTDAESRMRKYQRLMGFLAIVNFPVAMGLFNMRLFFLSPLQSPHWIGWVLTGIASVMMVLFVLYVYIFIRIGMRIRQLKHQ